MDRTFFYTIDAALKSAREILEREIAASVNKSDAVRQHTTAFFEPVIQRFDQARVLLKSMEHTDTDRDTVVQRLSHVLTDMDDHVIKRLRTQLDSQQYQALSMLRGRGVETIDPIQSKLPENAQMKTQFTLLQQINTVIESAKSEITTTGEDTEQYNLIDPVTIPASVKKALTDKRKELQDILDNQIKLGKTDWTFALPATQEGEPKPARIRVGLDGAIGMLEWIESVFDGDEVEYHDLREVVIKLSSYGNVIRQHLPSEVVRFLYTAGEWKKWREARYQGELLDGADPVTGFIDQTKGTKS